ncbi:hypothetical protein LLEC1_02033 [Akanthomyces lecanii]|uniref:DUF7729 domain-containing protein n=1 Tax=Cordyceps confragosa TaxID=2714763 RepID=A0A179HZS4_CORDF|nr:hypothetical protein LLEC1_02033 [Akanthomyces lecanii]
MNHVSHSSTASGTTTPGCQCSTRTARTRRTRRRSGSTSSTSSTPCAASHNRRSAAMSLRAGVMTALVAAAIAQQQPQQRDLWQLPAAVEAAAPASSPTIPSWTTEVEQDVQLVHDDLHAPKTVTHFTRQLDLAKRNPNAVIEVRGTVVARDSSGSAVAGQSASASSIVSSSEDSSSTSSSSSSSSSSSADSSSSPLPSPFDDAPTLIFKSPSSTSDACPAFMKKLLSDPTFKECYPLSMMLRTSTSFFQAEKQLVSIVRVLDATCAPNVDKCEKFLTQAAKNLIESSNCKKEYDANQVSVTEAFNGLRAYKVLYAATCLQNPSTQNYCFASAVTNVTNPSDIFFYSMPLGLPLPGGLTPSCGYCTTQTMAIFHTAALDRSQKLSSTYRDAARQVNTICGPGFVNDTATSGAGRLAGAPEAATTLVTVLFATLLGLTFMAW